MDAFWLQVALSFIVGGFYIAASIHVAEKFGSRFGGMVLGLPSTTLVSLFFIGWAQGTQAVADATSVMPLAIAVIGVFQVVFYILQKRGLMWALLGATAAWLALAVPLAVFKINDMAITLPLGLALYGAGWAYFRKVPNRKAEAHAFSKTEFLIRTITCGLIIAAAVALSKTAGPLWGGVMASFPAAFSSTVLLISGKHGAAFTDSVIKAMQMALMTIIIFVTIAHVLVNPLGLVFGLGAAYVASVGVGVVLSAKIQ